MNNQPSAVILSPEEYTRLTEIEEDYYLLIEATKRIEDNGNKETVSMDYVMRNLGIDEKELENAEDIDIEWYGGLSFTGSREGYEKARPFRSDSGYENNCYFSAYWWAGL